MKIVINKGENIENAMKSIQEFLTENYSDYPILKNTLNLYVTLKNGEGSICPDNEKEYIISKGHAKDVIAEDKNLALDERRYQWEMYVYRSQREVLNLRKSIEVDENYINTAEEKNRKKEIVEKRKREYENRKEKLKQAQELESLFYFLNSLVREDRMITMFIKNTFGSTYKYKIEVVYIFDNINGYTGFFDWKGLHNGLPSYYK